MEIFPELDFERIKSRISDPTRRYAPIKRKVTPRQMQAVYDMGVEGVIFEKEVQRLYPAGQIAGHFIGYTNREGRGVAGVEQAHNERLLTSREPLRLTLDAGVQFELEDELKIAAKAYNVIGAAGIVLEADTGAVRAMASWPPINPNRLGEATNPNYPDLDNGDPLLNRVSNAVYELGSVFKPLTIAAALDAGEVMPSQKFNVAKPLIIGRERVVDDHPIAGKCIHIRHYCSFIKCGHCQSSPTIGRTPSKRISR